MRKLGSIAIVGILGAGAIASSVLAQDVRPTEFAEPSADYRPTVTTEEGAGYAAPLEEAARRAIEDLDAGSIMISPQGDPERKKELDAAAIATAPIGLMEEYPEGASPWLPEALPGEARFGSYFADGRGGPGAEPSLGYMTPEWFAAMRKLLDMASAAGLGAVYYDEAGFPSGSADNTIPSKYYRKLLRRDETTVSAHQPFRLDLAAGEKPLAVVALDSASGKRVDLLALAEGGEISWKAPSGNWRVQSFYVSTSLAKGKSPDYNAAADYLDPEATQWFLENAYDRAYAGLSDYFGSTVRYTFFDDVGIYSDEKTWHPAIAERFEKITGKPADLYYPALWQDIGPDTAAARVGFFKARAELLGDTFPKLLTDWAHAHGVKSTGHAPGNYDIQPTDTIGDPFKFYAHTDMPMADVLWGLGFARGGFKLISSVSAQRDLPLTAAEAFSVNNDANGYRRMIELFVRGFNYFITGARVPSEPKGTGAQLNQWAGRSSYLLRGGRHVADVAILFPIESLQAFYAFNAPGNSARLPAGAYAYQDADYQAVGEMFLTELHRDFTFVHPDALGSAKFEVRGNRLVMQNEVNEERFRILVVPGGEVLSVSALAKIKAFYDAGGAVIGTSLLPSKSAEFGRDEEIREGIAAIFGTPAEGSEPEIRRNAAGGRAVFLPDPDPAVLRSALELLGETPDVALSGNPTPKTGNGVFGYIHRQRGGRDIYYFGNSSDTAVDTLSSLRGHLVDLAFWNPHDGSVAPIEDVRHVGSGAQARTEFRLVVPPVSSLAVVGRRR